MAVFNRVKQFWNAIFSKLTTEDLELLKTHLNEIELSLFLGMDRPTQTHCVRVARTSINLLPEYGSINKQVVMKAALLHDIGKPPNVIGTIDRVLIVLLDKFAPRLHDKLLHQKTTYGHFHKALVAHARHPHLGAELAEAYHLSSDLISLIRNHHRSESLSDPLELRVLREADNLN